MSIKVKKSLQAKLNWKLLSSIAIVVLLIASLELTNTTHIFHKQKAVSGTIPSRSPSKDTSSELKTPNKTAPSASGFEDSPKSATATSGSGAPLVAPYGTFVSNHKPSLSGSDGVPSQEQSVCITTPGANCYIVFTQGNVTKRLESKTADSKGAVYWDWDVKEAGLTEGTWIITATSILNGEGKSTKDNLALVINS